MASEYVSFDAGYQMTPDDKMREQMEAEILGTKASEDKQQQETANPKAEETKEEPHKKEDAENNKEEKQEEPKMENVYDQQQQAVQEEEGLFHNTREFIGNNPVTAVAGVALVAGVTVLVAKKVMKPSIPDTLSLVPASSMASAVAKGGAKAMTKAAKYSALMMRH